MPKKSPQISAAEQAKLPPELELVGSETLWKVRIPLIADTYSNLISDSVPGDRGHPGWGA